MGSNCNYEEEFGGPLYMQHDWNHYPVCFSCRRYSVFMFYLGDIEKARAIYPNVFQGELILCSECVPLEAEYGRAFPGERIYSEDSILNNSEILDLLEDFCYNVPTFEKYANLDRLILTSNVMLKSDYKKLIRRPLPKMSKLKVLMSLFPTVHRFPNRKYTNAGEVIGAVKDKYNEIRGHYRNLPEEEVHMLHDQLDMVVFQTPRHLRLSQNRTLSQQPVNPVVEEQQRAADTTVESAVDVSMSSANTSSDCLRQMDGSDISDESMQISSQSLSGHGVEVCISSQGTQPSSQEQGNSSSQVPDSVLGSSDESIQISSQSLALASASQEQGSTLAQRGRNNLQPSSDESAPEGSGSSSQSLQQISSQSVNVSGDLNVSSQGTQSAAAQSQPQPGSSQSQPALAISSQEIDVAQGYEISSNVSTSTDGDSDTSSNSNRTRRKRRSTDSTASEVDGSRSGAGRPKRARAETPVNPTPAEYVRNPSVARMPRLDGG